MNILISNNRYTYYEDGITEIEINNSFKNVLRFFKLVKDDRLDNEEKLYTLMKLFLDDQKISDVQLFYDNLLLFISEGKTKTDSNSSDKTEDEIIDFDIDSGYIYAAFKQAYNIDLTKEDMHWYVFMALLKSIPSDTKLSEVMNIRAKKIPKSTKYNKEEVAELKRLKEIYGLNNNKQKATVSDGLNAFYEMVVGSSG